MHKQDGLVALHESIASSPSSKRKKGKTHYPTFNWKIQRSLSLRAIENASHKDQYDATPARTEVFATIELLYEIFSHIPVKHLASARRVSKTWNIIAHKIGYYVDPVRVHTNVPTWPYSYPEYSDSVPLVFNPMFSFPPDEQKAIPSIQRHCFELSLDCKFRAPISTELGDQFLTSPPITQITLTGIPFKERGNFAVLRMPGGILYRDLGQAVRRLGVLDAGAKCSRKKCLGHEVGFSFHCVKGAQKDFPQGRWRMKLRLRRAFSALKMRDCMSSGGD